MDDADHALEVLTRLDAMGVRLSIDDFGTGYSSLSYLKRLPVDEIKIDRSFVMDMKSDNNDAIIVRSTIDLAHNMGLRVVAEGVENAEALGYLGTLGCDMAQGYFISRPVPYEDLVSWLANTTRCTRLCEEPSRALLLCPLCP
jgi:EAL domain-containing protein (putative c-di-GMP-specific phosphodiesterase class I)